MGTCGHDCEPSRILELNMRRKASHRAVRMQRCACTARPSTRKHTSLALLSVSSDEKSPRAAALSATRCAPSMELRGCSCCDTDTWPAESSARSTKPPRARSSRKGPSHASACPAAACTSAWPSCTSVANSTESNQVVHRSRLPRAQAPMYDEVPRRKGMCRPPSASMWST
eukprot:scaffold56880_cov64-Phaeocystis_antarctica.AAC.2